MRSLPGRLGYSLLGGGEEGMSPAELRALPIVIHERRHGGGCKARPPPPREDLSADLSVRTRLLASSLLQLCSVLTAWPAPGSHPPRCSLSQLRSVPTCCLIPS
jgi:hypothetical protein